MNRITKIIKESQESDHIVCTIDEHMSFIFPSWLKCGYSDNCDECRKKRKAWFLEEVEENG